MNKILSTAITLLAITSLIGCTNTTEDPDSRATDYNSSRSNRTTNSSLEAPTDTDSDDEETADTNEAVDQNCTGDDCPALDEDSDNDSISTEAQAEGYIKIDDVKGESNR